MNFRSLSRSSVVALILSVCLSSVIISSLLGDSRLVGGSLTRTVAGDFTPDGWVGPSATFRLPGFLGGINSIEAKFDPRRVGATEAAQVAISVCNQPEIQYDLERDSTIRLETPWFCRPITLGVRSLNFFTPSGTSDRRKLGTKLVSISVRSPVGMPVADLETLMVVLAALCILLTLVYFVAQGAGAPGGVCAWLMLVFILSFVIFLSADPSNLQPLTVVIGSALFGMCIYSVCRNSYGEDVKYRLNGWLLPLALMLGAFLRLYGIKFGLPANYHPDEVPKVNAIMRMYEGGTLNPHYFLHPSLLLYTTYGMNQLIHFLNFVDGPFRDSLFLAGRIVSFSAGMISILLTYLIGRALFSVRTGTIAAFLLAVFPLHVTCSRYLKEDSLLTCIALSCLYVTILSVQKNRRWLLLIAGLLAGCTAGTKYSGILMAIVPASAPWMVSRRLIPDFRWLPWALLAVVIAPLGFLATTPYALLNSTKFLHDFMSESRHMRKGHTVSITAWSQLWMYHFWRSIWPGMTGMTTVASCMALGFLARRGKIEDLVILSAVLMFYLPAEYVKAKPAPQPERYILPCLPFLAIGLAELLSFLSSIRSRLARSVVPLIMVVVIGSPFVQSVFLAREVVNDTRDQLASWMTSNLPQGTKVLMDWKPYCPHFADDYFDVKHIARARIILELEVDALRKSGAEYLVLSSLFYNRYFSQPSAEPSYRQQFREVFQRVPIVKQFEAASGPYGFHNPTLTIFSLREDDFQRLDLERERKKLGEIQYTSNDIKARAKW